MPIEEIVEFDLGLELLPIDSYGVEAFLSWNRAHVYVDRQTMMTVPGRYRFSLAHEVGHYVFAGLVLIPRNLLRAKVAYHESRAKAAGFPPSILYEGEGFDRLVQSLSESFGAIPTMPSTAPEQGRAETHGTTSAVRPASTGT